MVTIMPSLDNIILRVHHFNTENTHLEKLFYLYHYGNTRIPDV